MKQTTLTQRLLSALVALCMVLSVCAPALAAEPGRASAAVIYYQKDGGKKTLLDALSIKTLMPGYKITFVRNLIIITMGSTEHTGELDGVTLSGNGSDPYNFELCTAGTNWVTDIRSSSNIGLTITGMKNVTVTPAKGSSIGFLGSLKIVDCTGDVNIQNSSSAAVVGRLEVDNSAGHGGSVTITENCDREDWGTYLPYGTTITSNGPVKIENKNGCAVCGSLEIKESASVDIKGTATNGRAAILGSATISSNGPVKIENQTSNDWKAGAAVGYKDDPNITGTILEVKKSASVEVIGAGVNPTLGGWASIKSSGDVSITNSLGGSAVGRGLTVTTGGAVTVTGDNDAAIKSTATITAGRNVSIQNKSGIAVEGKLIVNSSTGVTVVGNTPKNAVRYEANITSSGAVNISNSQGIAVGGKLTVNNASGTGDVTVTGTGNATLNNGADITSRGAVSITNTGSGLAVDGKLTVYNSGSVKVSGGNASAPAVSGDITLTSTGKMELSNPKGQVTSKKLTVKNSTGEVSVTGNKSDGSALVQGGASIGTTGTVTITNSSGPAIFSGLNVEQSGGITVTGSRASEPIITDSSTIKNTNKVEIINNGTNGQTAQSITYTPPEGKGYFYQTTQNGSKLHTRSAISSTTPYLCIEPDTLYTLTLPEGVTATTGGTKDTKFYAGESVTVTAPADTDTKKFESWTLSGKTPSDLSGHWETKNPLTFTMPEGNVTLTAKCKTAYTLTVADGRGSFTVNGAARTQALEGETVTVKASDTFFDAYRKFDGWKLSGDSAQMVEPSENWQTSKEFTFKMPAGNVTLTADYKQLYNLTVTGGTIVDESSDTGKPSGIYLPGTEVTVTAPADTDTKKFEKWTFSGTEPTDLPNDWQTSKKFTFTMPAGNVTLKADYMQLYNLTVTGGTIVDGSGTGKTTGSFQPGDEVKVAFTESTGIEDQFEKWTLSGTEPTDLPNDWQSKPSFSFTMPAGNVTLKAEYKTVYNVSVADSRGTVLVNNEERSRALEGETVTVKTSDTFFNAYHQFNGWSLSDDSAQMVEPSENWQTSKEFTFTMPAGNVTLKADYMQLYNLTVTGGTIVDGSGTGKTTGSFQPGDEVKVAFTESTGIEDQFEKWTLSGTEPTDLPNDWQSKPSFSFTMPAGNVTLKAEYKTVYNVSVADSRGTVLVNNEERSRALEGETVTVKTSDTFFNAYHQFNGWSLSDDSAQMVEPSENWQTSKEFTFTMPAGNVTLKADYKQLYDLTVTGGTIVDESGDTGIYLPGTKVTVVFTESDDITKQFKQWTGGENITNADPDNWQNSKRFTFTMPDSAVTLTAVYRETYHLSEYTNKAEFFVNDQQVNQAPAGVRVTVKLVDGFINDHREFDQWLPVGGTALVAPEEGWAHKPSFSFIMPEGMVLLQAHTTFLYDVIVTHGTIVDGTGDTGAFQKIVKPGQLVTVRAESTEENPFLRWNSTSEAPAAPDGGWPEGDWQTSPEFTFKMPNGNVTLEAQRDQLYKVSINDSLGNVTINGEQRSSLWVKGGEAVTVATTLKDGYWMDFMKWTAQDGSATPVEPSDNWQTSTTFTFKMPNGPVELVAQWSASPVARPDPDEPLDEDFGVEPAPMDTTGGTIAAVAVGGAAIWGGYEIATRVILHSLLPEGTVIPASRGQLALLVWNTAGRPEPAGAPAFADVTDPDMAKAAQWCTEQGTMAAKGDRFEPEGWTPKFKVIEVWNKAFPAA